MAEWQGRSERSYPLGKALPVLTEWTKAHGADGAMVEGLTIGGLSSPLKAKKRAELRERLEEVAQVSKNTEFYIGPVKG